MVNTTDQIGVAKSPDFQGEGKQAIVVSFIVDPSLSPLHSLIIMRISDIAFVLPLLPLLSPPSSHRPCLTLQGAATHGCLHPANLMVSWVASTAGHARATIFSISEHNSTCLHVHPQTARGGRVPMHAHTRRQHKLDHSTNTTKLTSTPSCSPMGHWEVARASSHRLVMVQGCRRAAQRHNDGESSKQARLPWL